MASVDPEKVNEVALEIRNRSLGEDQDRVSVRPLPAIPTIKALFLGPFAFESVATGKMIKWKQS